MLIDRDDEKRIAVLSKCEEREGRTMTFFSSFFPLSFYYSIHPSSHTTSCPWKRKTIFSLSLSLTCNLRSWAIHSVKDSSYESMSSKEEKVFLIGKREREDGLKKVYFKVLDETKTFLSHSSSTFPSLVSRYYW